MKRCLSKLKIDAGDGKAKRTFNCQLPSGHYGTHHSPYEQDGRKLCVTWLTPWRSKNESNTKEIATV